MPTINLDRIPVLLTNDRDLDPTTLPLKRDLREMSWEDICAFLEADPRHAVVLRIHWTRVVAIARDGSDETYWWEKLPFRELEAEGDKTLAQVKREIFAPTLK